MKTNSETLPMAPEIPERWSTCTFSNVLPNDLYDISEILTHCQDLEYTRPGVLCLMNDSVAPDLSDLLAEITERFPHVEIVFDDNLLKTLHRNVRSSVQHLLRAVGLVT